MRALRRPSPIFASKYLESMRASCVQVAPPFVDFEMYMARSCGGIWLLRSAVRPQRASGFWGSVAMVSMKSLAKWWLPGRLVTRWTRHLARSSSVSASRLVEGDVWGCSVWDDVRRTAANRRRVVLRRMARLVCLSAMSRTFDVLEPTHSMYCKYVAILVKEQMARGVAAWEGLGWVSFFYSELDVTKLEIFVRVVDGDRYGWI
jgi:hypothetical protein